MMSFGDILYIVAMVLFALMTFGIIKHYYKSKFDDEGRRKDILEEKDSDN